MMKRIRARFFGAACMYDGVQKTSLSEVYDEVSDLELSVVNDGQYQSGSAGSCGTGCAELTSHVL